MILLIRHAHLSDEERFAFVVHWLTMRMNARWN